MPPRFLDEKDAYPAGVEGVTARWVRVGGEGEGEGGCRVRVVECGAEGGGGGEGGTNVVMLPGWGCSAYAFRKNIGAIAEGGARVTVVEMKGQGWSDKPLGSGEYTVAALTRHVLDVLDALEVETASLVGLSLGGLVAAKVALAAPERVERLALLDPVGFGRVRLVGLARLFPAGMGSALPAAAARRWAFALALRSAYGSRGRPTVRDIDEYFAPARDPAFVRALWAQLHEIDWRVLTADELRRIAVPLLVIFGSEDRLVSPRECEELVKHAADGSALLIEGAGHATPEEVPDEVNEALTAFMRDTALSRHPREGGNSF